LAAGTLVSTPEPDPLQTHCGKLRSGGTIAVTTFHPFKTGSDRKNALMIAIQAFSEKDPPAGRRGS